MRFKKTSLLTALAAAVIMQSAAWALPEAKEAPLNPDFVRYMQKIRDKTLSPAETGGRIPSPMDKSYLKRAPEPEGKAAVRRVFPSRYDLRDEGLVTPVRNQGEWGTCWVHSAIASLESQALDAGVENPDYSEMFMAYYGFIDQVKKDGQVMPGFYNYSPQDYPEILTLGGNDDMMVALLSRGTGAVDESDAPYGDTSKAPDPLAPVIRRLNDSYEYSYNLDGETLDVESVVPTIKNAVMKHGALSIGIYVDDSHSFIGDDQCYDYLNSSRYTPAGFLPPKTPSNHAVTLVGWDDTFPASSFKTAAPGDGAWIIKDSWGAGLHDRGYFYLSYYDSSIDGAVAFEGGDPKEFDSIYQHDPLGATSRFGWGNEAGMANVFTAKEDTSVTAVAFYSLGTPAQYQIAVYTGLSGNFPDSGTLGSSQSVELQEPGYHTVRLKTPAPIKAGEKFSVVINMNVTGDGMPIALEAKRPGSDKAQVNPGESFVARNVWLDVTEEGIGNVCIKALCSSGAAPVPPVPPAPSETGSIKATILPAEAVAAGGAWMIDEDGTWRESGDTVSGLSVGDHLITVKPLPNFDSPDPANVPVKAGNVTDVEISYAPKPGGGGGGGGGGCSVGFAPAALLLLLPLTGLIKKR